jgi:hypothetical protein
MQGVSKKALQWDSKCCYVYATRLHLKACKLYIIQRLERWAVCTPLSVNVFVTLATQQHLEYLFETPYTVVGFFLVLSHAFAFGNIIFVAKTFLTIFQASLNRKPFTLCVVE